MVAVNRKFGESDDTRPFTSHPYVPPRLPVIPAGDWNNPARMIIATERLKRATKLVETENDRANKEQVERGYILLKHVASELIYLQRHFMVKTSL